MATGNFILNGSRKKVGSIVTYRRNGKQVIRAAATSVANPKTVAQSRRRCFFSPAAKFYSAMATILETSFQGKNKSQSYSAFLKKAIDDAAANGWYTPKGLGFFPMPYQLSKGTIQPVEYMFDRVDNDINLTATPAAAPTTIGELSQIFKGLGYEDGMQITFIFICTDTNMWSGDPVDFYGANYWVRSLYFIIEPSSTVTIADALPGLTTDLDETLAFALGTTNLAGAAIIASKFENGSWKRSTQRLDVNNLLVEMLSDIDNVNASIASYGYSTSNVESNVYLNQGDGESTSAASSIALNDGTAVTLRTLNYVQGAAQVVCMTGVSSQRTVQVKIGNDYLLSATTKGSLPEGVTPTTTWLDGTNAEIQAWLQSQGVAASVFQ